MCLLHPSGAGHAFSTTTHTRTSYDLLAHTDNHHIRVRWCHADFLDGQVPTTAQNIKSLTRPLSAWMETRLACRHIHTPKCTVGPAFS